MRDLSNAQHEAGVYITVGEALREVERLGCAVVVALVQHVKDKQERVAVWQAIAAQWCGDQPQPKSSDTKPS